MSLSDEIISFMRKLANDTRDRIPNKPQIHLLLLTKKQVYDEFLLQYGRPSEKDPLRQPPSENFFYSVWHGDCAKIKTWKHYAFAKCAACENFRSELVENVGNDKRTGGVQAQKKAHIKFIEVERQGYYTRRGKAVLYPSRYFSVIMDGTDQKSYGLPHFAYNSKSDRGHKLKVKCVGALKHRKMKQLSLFATTDEFATGANHVIEMVHPVLNRKRQTCTKLPPTAFIQVDNCSRENKNRYLMSYFELLVAHCVFQEVQVSFLPVGHTHEDVDQAFSRIAQRLLFTDAHIMGELLKEIKNSYTPEPVTSELL